MNTYTKLHTSKTAAQAHLAKIKQRGGIAAVKEANGKTEIDYYFPDKKISEKKTPKKATKRRKYDVLSPDGFTIRIGVPPFTSVKARDDYFEKWKQRFAAQGYYSAAHRRIPLEDLAMECQWIELSRVG